MKEYGEKVVGLLVDDWIEVIKEGKNELSLFVILFFLVV